MRLTSRLLGGALLVLPVCTALAQGRPPRPRITGISHVAFKVSDIAAARRFYGETLGLVEKKGTTAFSGVDQAKKAVVPFWVGSHQQIVLEPGLQPADDERLSHLAFATPDVTAMAAYLRARGLEVRQPPDRCQETAIRVLDPDGHVIEFVQEDWPPPTDNARSDAALSTRVLHAGLTIRDDENAHAFYRDALGFSEIWRGGRPEGVTQWINMRVPDGTNYLEYMLISSPPDRRRLGTLHHVALMVPDMQTAWEEVVRRTPASARAALAPPAVGVNGRWQLNLFDPDGTRVELMEPFRIR
jgi:lactoylglutathione lyase